MGWLLITSGPSAQLIMRTTANRDACSQVATWDLFKLGEEVAKCVKFHSGFSLFFFSVSIWWQLKGAQISFSFGKTAALWLNLVLQLYLGRKYTDSAYLNLKNPDESYFNCSMKVFRTLDIFRMILLENLLKT